MIVSFATDHSCIYPWMDKCSLLKHNNGKISFSTDKPNVIVTKNGAGKSGMLQLIAKRYLAYNLGYSHFENKIITSEDYFVKSDKYWETDAFMPGVFIETEGTPIVYYYEPMLIPGHAHFVAEAMCLGYGDNAMEFGKLTKNKSSGQKRISLLNKLLDTLEGKEPLINPINIGKSNTYFRKNEDTLIGAFNGINYGKPVFLFDEPEQSLDLYAQKEFWDKIFKVNFNEFQVIIATHSLFPLLDHNLQKCNFITDQKDHAKYLADILK